VAAKGAPSAYHRGRLRPMPERRIPNIPSLRWRRTPRPLPAASKPTFDGEEEEDKITRSHDEDEIWKGTLVLWTVPMAWGTFEVAVRYVYTTLPELPTLLFSASYYAVATIALLLILTVQRLCENNDSARIVISKKEKVELAPVGVAPDAVDLLTTSSPRAEGIQPQPAPSVLDSALRGGLELGTYLFLGNLLQLVGLLSISANRAAFLLQLTTVFVPLLQGVVSWRIWRACGLALLGVGVMSFDVSSLATTTTLFDEHQLLEALQWSVGDTCVVGAALAYTGHCIRLERYAQQIPNPVLLGASKAATECAWTLFLLGAVLYLSQSPPSSAENASWLTTTGRECWTFLRSNSHEQWDAAVPAILWTGCVPIAYTIVAQSYGQRRVRPVQANLIYTIQPVATAFFAYWILQEESLQWNGYLGGALIGAAVLLVVQEDS
jgi:drug/metabolite transporter (DMT)-like permease